MRASSVGRINRAIISQAAVVVYGTSMARTSSIV
jgi:hypothetical protein